MIFVQFNLPSFLSKQIGHGMGILFAGGHSLVKERPGREARHRDSLGLLRCEVKAVYLKKWCRDFLPVLRAPSPPPPPSPPGQSAHPSAAPSASRQEVLSFQFSERRVGSLPGPLLLLRREFQKKR